MSNSKPFKLIMEAESYHADSRLVILHTYLSGSLRNGLKYKDSEISIFSKNAYQNIYNCIRSFRNINKDIFEITKADVISVPLEYYKENLNKRCFNQQIMRDFIVFYLNIKSFNQPILSVIPVENKLLCQFNLPEINEGSRFSSEYLSCIKWLEMKHKLRAAFNGDVEAQQHVLSFLQPSFDYAEENKPAQIFENNSNQVSISFEKQNINGFLRINSALDKKNNHLSDFSCESAYILVNDVYVSQVKDDVQIMIVEEILSPFKAFSTINDHKIYQNNPECDENNWTHYIPEKPTMNFYKYNTRYQIYIVQTKLNKSKKVDYDIKTLNDAYKKAYDFLNGK